MRGRKKSKPPAAASRAADGDPSVVFPPNRGPPRRLLRRPFLRQTTVEQSSVRGSCRAHVYAWHGRRILPVRREDAPRGPSRGQKISFAGAKTARRPRDDRNAAIAD